MELSKTLHHQLTAINLALVQGQEEQLGELLGSCNLDEILSQKTLELARARNKSRMVIFLATLAHANEIDPQRAAWWLACYQSVLRREMQPAVAQLAPQNVVKRAVQALMEGQALQAGSLIQLKGTLQHWKDAFELLIDHRDWRSAFALLQSLGNRKSQVEYWATLSRSLASRHHLYVDESGLKQPEVDYDMLSHLYGICAEAARSAKLTDMSQAMTQLSAAALEVGGCYDQAIAKLAPLSTGKNSVPMRVTMSRCLCKKGDVSGAIHMLDTVLPDISLPHVSLKQDQQKLQKELQGEQKSGSFDTHSASKALRDMGEILRQKNINMFLVSGTLLGYIREGKLLDHDKDIDVGIIGWEQQYDLCLALQESGKFTTSAQFLKGHTSYYIPVLHHETGMWIDIFVYHEENGQWVTGVDFFFGYRQRFAFSPFALKPIEFMGVPMYCPDPAEQNLEENFGDWRTPDPSYISHLESPSTMDLGGADYMLTARLTTITALMKGNPHKLKKIISLMREMQDRELAMPDHLLNLLEQRLQTLRPVDTQEVADVHCV